MSKVLIAITKLLQEIKKDRWWNFIAKISAWILIAAVIIHVIWWIAGRQTRLWISEHNNFQPCTDTLILHDTLWKHDTIRIFVAGKKPTTEAKNNNSGNAHMVGDLKAKNVNFGTAEHVGDNVFKERTLTREESRELLKDVNAFRVKHNKGNCITIISAVGASGKIVNEVSKFLNANSYNATISGMFPVIEGKYELLLDESDPQCFALVVGVFD